MRRHVFLALAVLALALGGVAAPARQDVVLNAAPTTARAVHYIPALSPQRLAPSRDAPPLKYSQPCGCEPAVPGEAVADDEAAIPGALHRETPRSWAAWPSDIPRPASAWF